MKKIVNQAALAVLGLGTLVSCNNKIKGFSSENFTEAEVVSQLDSLLNLKTQNDSLKVKGLLEELKDDGNERFVMKAMNYYYRLGDIKTSDSIYKTIDAKFPNGIKARQQEANKISMTEGALEKEVLYKQWVLNFPPEMFPNEKMVSDYLVSNIAGAFAKEGNRDKAIEFTDKLQSPFWMSSGVHPVVTAFYAEENYGDAEMLIKKGIESSRVYINNPEDKSNEAGFVRQGYYAQLAFLADILLKQDKTDEALVVLEEYYNGKERIIGKDNLMYAQALLNKNQKDKAFEVLSEAVVSGNSNVETEELFKFLYLEIKGDLASYNSYISDVKKDHLTELKEKFKSEMIKEKAPNFSLVDFEGNTVSLSDYKNKIVVLDFWATWCGPCKRSFPAMQMAVNKYKNDSDVAFLFIHTWEKVDNPIEDAKQYIASNNYSFKVLMDLKDPETKVNKAVSDFNVISIPAKFVIDAEGFIRFKMAGFSGSDEMAVNELVTMIDILKE